MSPEQYRRLHEEYQKIDRVMGPAIAEQQVKEHEQQALRTKLLAEAEASCKAQAK